MKMRVSEASRGNKYVICQDSLSRDFYSYEIATGRIVNITKDIPIPLVDPEYNEPGYRPRGLYIAAWLENDAAVLLNDRFDIWLVDPSGKKSPVSLTNGYGRKHNIIFRLAGNYRNKTIAPTEKLILSAFDRTNKNNGFYHIVPGQTSGPEKLTMGPYVYHVPDHFNPSLPSFNPLKARDAEVYLVRRESAEQAPNYFLTSDFRTFRQISQVYPEKNYNWLKTELINWKR